MTTATREAAATDRLSRAASAIWLYRNADPDPMGDPSGDCGDLIAAGERRHLLRMVAAAGYATPGEYNADLNRALGVGPPDEQGRTAMSYRTYQLLSELEVGDVCPECGAALDVTSHYTRQYGGGHNTVYHCPACGYGDVCV
jgi:predicted RNA-binding Zn-ribbon protein involved in translation (DUF1610 family)